MATVTFKTYLTEEGALFDTETFNNNIDSIRAFFTEGAQLDVKVLGDFGEREEDAVAICCMMNDICREDSYTFRCLSAVHLRHWDFRTSR